MNCSWPIARPVRGFDGVMVDANGKEIVVYCPGCSAAQAPGAPRPAAVCAAGVALPPTIRPAEAGAAD